MENPARNPPKYSTEKALMSQKSKIKCGKETPRKGPHPTPKYSKKREARGRGGVRTEVRGGVRSEVRGGEEREVEEV